MKIKILMLLLVIALFITVPTLGVNGIRVYVDGNEISFPDQKPYINTDNRTMVPVRFVSQALGANVDWQATTNTVLISHQAKDIKLITGQKIAQVDSIAVDLDTAASLVNSRTMVPLRFISECLGAKVEWIATQQAVYITTEKYISDQSYINSDLELKTPPPGDNPHNINLIAIVQYKYTTPVEPQFEDLREILEKRFGEKAEPVVAYVSSKKDTKTRLLTKDWTIDGKHIGVDDSVGYVTVTVWN